jgi:hypothetical protein
MLFPRKGSGVWRWMDAADISMGARRDTKAAISLVVGMRRGEGTTRRDISCNSIDRAAIPFFWMGVKAFIR